ncbi:MAG: DUF89 family protein [Candidatus Desulforudis sp.]|nr:DUF89 family protein [Desulforudis sp.]
MHNTAALATADPDLRARAVGEGLAVLEREFPRRRVPTQIAGEAQRVVRRVTGNADPYREAKDREIGMAARIITRIRDRFGGDYPGLMRLAALGNAVDFFKDLDTVVAQMHSPVDFVLDQTGEFLKRLDTARLVLYLADNAAECYFDYPLLAQLAEDTEVFYVLKEGPVQNDLTMDDLVRAGFAAKVQNIITTGTDTPGLDWETVPAAVRELFERADLVLAKGMGNYETLSECGFGHKVFFLLMAKCRPVAGSLGVPLDSFVAAFSSTDSSAGG